MSESYHFEINEEGEGLIKVHGKGKVSRKTQKARTRLISRIMIGSTLLYIVVALLYNYSIAINITLR